MKRKRKWIRRVGIGLGVAALSTAVAAGASAHGVQTVTIRHQLRGCHAWSFAGGGWRAALRVTTDRDALVRVVNNDVMPHRLVQISGPKLPIFAPNMHRMGAHAWFTLAGKGVYVFKTRAGDDYPGMAMRTVGPDNVLRLTIVAN